jgi:hypothetical protein
VQLLWLAQRVLCQYERSVTTRRKWRMTPRHRVQMIEKAQG